MSQAWNTGRWAYRPGGAECRCRLARHNGFSRNTEYTWEFFKKISSYIAALSHDVRVSMELSPCKKYNKIFTYSYIYLFIFIKVTVTAL